LRRTLFHGAPNPSSIAYTFKQTVLSAAGDNGAADCDEQANPNGPPIISATQGLQVDYPASSAYVTGMGGSEFTGDGTDSSP
jgi:subtilase family serine protease